VPGGITNHLAERVVDRAREVVGVDLVGVVLYGSWARDEAADTSDVDVALVLDRSVSLGPQLYRAWEGSPLQWDGRPIEAQFVRIPAEGGTPSGFWAELALDGIVLFDPRFRVAKQLVRTRRDFAAGRLIRYVSHGQAYWVESEVA
jgi:hypothetical protein